MTVCSVDGCAMDATCRGMCSKHDTRVRRYGDPHHRTRFHGDPQLAFEQRTYRADNEHRCLVWTGATDRSGRGQMRINGKLVMAHVWAWEQKNGPVPPGHELDHAVCNNGRGGCVEPDHCEPATKSENISRYWRWRRALSEAE